MRYLRLFIFVFFAMLFNMVNAQSEEATHFNTWWSLKAKADLSDKIYVNGQVSLRRYDILKSWQKIILRARGLYRINELVVAGLGYTYSRNFEPNQPSQYVSIPRSDIFSEFGFTNKFDDLKLINRFRLEHRFSGIMQIPEDVNKRAFIDGTKFSNRLRYRITFKYPLLKINGAIKIYAAGFYELFLRMDNKFKILNISGNIFKVVGGYRLNEMITIEAGYRRHIKHEKDYSFKEVNNILDLSLKYRFDFSDVFSEQILPFLSSK